MSVFPSRVLERSEEMQIKYVLAIPAIAAISFFGQPAFAQSGGQPYSSQGQNQQYSHDQFDRGDDHGRHRMAESYKDGYRAGFRAAKHGDRYDDHPHFDEGQDGR
jgi:hypothetical protein